MRLEVHAGCAATRSDVPAYVRQRPRMLRLNDFTYVFLFMKQHEGMYES